MKIEIEAKMRLEDRQALITRLNKRGAKHQTDLLETNTFFDTEEGRLKSSDQGLRIRVEQSVGTDASRMTITHKGPRMHGKLKSRSETEVGVKDARAAADMLGALGFHPVLSFEKRRSRFKLDDCLIELDTLPLVGEFVEIGGPSEQAVLAVREKLDLGAAPLVKTSYISILLTYVRENNLTMNAIRFEDVESVVNAA